MNLSTPEDALESLRMRFETIFNEYVLLDSFTLFRASEEKPGAYSNDMEVVFDGKVHQANFWTDLENQVNFDDPIWEIDCSVKDRLMEFSPQEESILKGLGNVLIHRDRSKFGLAR